MPKQPDAFDKMTRKAALGFQSNWLDPLFSGEPPVLSIHAACHDVERLISANEIRMKREVALRLRRHHAKIERMVHSLEQRWACEACGDKARAARSICAKLKAMRR